MPASDEEEICTAQPFRVEKRTIVLFTVSMLLLLISSLDVNMNNKRRNQQQPKEGTKLESVARDFVDNNVTSSTSPGLVRTCGPGQLSGQTDLGSGFSKWLPWSAARTGTLCRHVRFRTAFTNAHDIRLFVTADRSMAERNGHLTPIVWAEKIEADGFQACAHFNCDFNQDPEYWRENLRISWWALDSESPPETARKYLGRVRTKLANNRSVCIALPEEVNPHSNTVLVSTSHPGMNYEKYYTYQPSSRHTPRESVLSWIDEKEDNKFEVCAKRLYEKTKGTIEDAGVDVVSIRRDKRFTGLTKIKLGEYGRGCVYVDGDLTKIGQADDDLDELPMVFVQSRINRLDHGDDGTGPQVVAWVEQKLARGFTVCAKNLGRGVRQARHTIQIHWIAVHEVAAGMDSSVCRDGVVAV